MSSVLVSSDILHTRSLRQKKPTRNFVAPSPERLSDYSSAALTPPAIGNTFGLTSQGFVEKAAAKAFKKCQCPLLLFNIITSGVVSMLWPCKD